MAKRTYKKSKPKKRRLVKPPDLLRRHVRYILFRIKRDTVITMDREFREAVPIIRKVIEKQLLERFDNWAGFTFDWDVSASDPYKVIGPTLKEWVEEGGSFEGRPPNMSREEWARHVLANGLSSRRDPPAFTHQE